MEKISWDVISNGKDIMGYYIRWDMLGYAHIWFVEGIRNKIKNILDFNV